ncbi:MAG: hypothetical protein ACTSSE_06890 [Candidatus Thorarchaeota archaeon]
MKPVKRGMSLILVLFIATTLISTLVIQASAIDLKSDIPSSQQSYTVSIEIDRVIIYNDRDIIGFGEIYLKARIDSEVYEYTSIIGNVDNGETL